MAGGAQDDDFFRQWWIVGSYTTPRSIFMAPAVGGVAHGPVNARPRAERPQRAEGL
jgi:hypothetical protein